MTKASSTDWPVISCAVGVNAPTGARSCSLAGVIRSARAIGIPEGDVVGIEPVPVPLFERFDVPSSGGPIASLTSRGDGVEPHETSVADVAP